MNNIPKELLTKRDTIECNFIFSLYKNPDLIGDYKNVENSKDIITEDGIFYYGLAQNLYKNGFSVFDNISIYAYLQDSPVLKKGFEQRGGYNTIKEITELIAEENIDAYYDDLVKSNLLIRLNDSGFPVIDKLDKLNKMSSEDVYNYYDYLLNNVSVGKIEKIKTEDLSDGYDKYIDEWDKGTSVGYKISAPIMNYMLAGIHRGNLTLHLGGIGQGKTTTAILLYVISAIENGENVLIIANEQSCSEFRQMIMASVLFNKIGAPKGMNRQKFIIGNFDDAQKEALHKTADWIKTQKGKIRFVEMQNYDILNVRKIIKKYSKLNYGLMIFDTLKPINDASERSWGEFSEVAKELFILAKNCDVAIVATAQLTPDALSRTYLDLSCIGKSRSIAETCSTVVGFRPLTTEEVEKIKPYKFVKDERTYTKTKKSMTLDPSKHYIMWFIMKNRFGATNPQIVAEFDQSFCKLTEVGYYNCPFDRYVKK